MFIRYSFHANIKMLLKFQFQYSHSTVSVMIQNMSVTKLSLFKIKNNANIIDLAQTCSKSGDSHINYLRKSNQLVKFTLNIHLILIVFIHCDKRRSVCNNE